MQEEITQGAVSLSVEMCIRDRQFASRLPDGKILPGWMKDWEPDIVRQKFVRYWQGKSSTHRCV